MSQQEAAELAGIVNFYLYLVVMYIVPHVMECVMGLFSLWDMFP
jgi:hypothetical protein